MVCHHAICNNATICNDAAICNILFKKLRGDNGIVISKLGTSVKNLTIVLPISD